MKEPNVIVIFVKMPGAFCKEPPNLGEHSIIEEVYEPDLRVEDGSVLTPYGIPNRRWLQENKSRIRPELWVYYMEALKSIGR